jgi:hypothetical protein
VIGSAMVADGVPETPFASISTSSQGAAPDHSG